MSGARVRRRIQRILALLVLLGITSSLGAAAWWKIKQGRQPMHAPELNTVRTSPGPPPRNDAETTPQWNAVGLVMPFRQASLSAKITSAVLPHDLRIGRPVKAGEVLLQLDDRFSRLVLTEHKQRLELAQEERDDAEADLKKSERLNNDHKGAISADRLRKARVKLKLAQLRIKQLQTQIERQKVSLRDYQVVSPFNGQIRALRIEVGESVMPGRPILELVQIDPIKIQFHVLADRRLRIRTDDPYLVESRLLTEYRAIARVHEIAPEERSGSRRFGIILRMANPPEARLWPGMAVMVRPATKEELKLERRATTENGK